MADTRKIILVRAIINGHPVMAALEEFTPPTVEKSTEEVKGGLFIGYKTVVGIELGDWSLKIMGASPEAIEAMGAGEEAEVTVLESVKGDDGVGVKRLHEMSGEVIKAEEGTIKVGREEMTITGSPYAYTLTEAGKIVHDLNGKTQKCVVAGVDLLAEARGHVDLA